MSTVSPRINASFAPSTMAMLEMVAKKRQTSLSALVREYVEQALEDDEDYDLAKLGDAIYERNKDKPTYSHEDAWSE